MSDDLDFSWSSLSLHARRTLLEDPHGVVPAKHIPEIVQSGGSVHLAYWVAAGPNAEGFRLDRRQADVIATWRGKLDRWWRELPDDARAVVLEHRGGRIPEEYSGAVLTVDLVGGVVRGTVAADEPSRDGFELAPIAKDFVDWVASQKEE